MYIPVELPVLQFETVYLATVNLSNVLYAMPNPKNQKLSILGLLGDKESDRCFFNVELTYQKLKLTLDEALVAYLRNRQNQPPPGG